MYAENSGLTTVCDTKAQEPASIIPQEPANNKPSRRETVSTWVPCKKDDSFMLG